MIQPLFSQTRRLLSSLQNGSRYGCLCRRVPD